MEYLKTHLHDFHQKKGYLVKFAGFEMPLSYEGISAEHLAVRNGVGVFDVTHMGRYVIEGQDSAAFLNYIIAQDVSFISIGQGRYSVMCNTKGGIVDDLVVFRLEENQFMITCNASNREKDFNWMSNHARHFRVEVKDVSNETVLLAVQGPKVISTLQPIVNVDLSSIRYYWGKWAVMAGERVFLTRTGYTGEDGFEILLPNTPLSEPEKAEKLWQTVLAAGQEQGIKPCGLGARDTLRLEAGMCFYGNDINEDTTPLEARLGFAVQLHKDDFIGKEALLRNKTEGVERIRVGIRALERGIPRSGNTIFLGEKEVGHVTSGTFSPLLRCGMAMGYVLSEHSQIGTEIRARTDRSFVHAAISTTPFYDEAKYGRKRSQI